MRRTITVPGAGESKSFGMTGLSVMIVYAPTYFSPQEAPALSFNNPGAEYPIENKNIYQSDIGEFNSIVITGTAESAGDEITLVTVDNCLETSIQGFAGANKALAGNTFTVAMTNNAQNIPEVQLVNSEGLLPKSIYISAGGGDIHYRWNDGSGTDPSPDSDVDYVLSDHSEPIEILGVDFILNIKAVAAVTDQTPNLIVTARY